MKAIELSRGKKAIVDDEDYERLMQWNWVATCNKSGNWYAECSLYLGGGKKNPIRKNIRMHRVLLNVTQRNVLVDHIDGDSLNNRRNNLRIADAKQNGMNMKSRPNSSSLYLGVSWNKPRRKWQVEMKLLRIGLYIGLFESEERAAHVRDLAAQIICGEFAKINILCLEFNPATDPWRLTEDQLRKINNYCAGASGASGTLSSTA